MMDRGGTVTKSKNLFLIVICMLIAGMFLCSFFAAIDNSSYDSVEGNFIKRIFVFVLFFFYMFGTFLLGGCIWLREYHNLGDYVIHNIVFYLFFTIIIIMVTIWTRKTKSNS